MNVVNIFFRINASNGLFEVCSFIENRIKDTKVVFTVQHATLQQRLSLHYEVIKILVITRTTAACMLTLLTDCVTSVTETLSAD